MKPRLSFWKTLGIGVIDTVIITAVMLPLVLSGSLGIEQPFAVTFVRSLFGESAPLPLGIAFHSVYVIFWSTIFVMYLTPRPFYNAAVLAGILWLIQASIFYPVVGWGFLGTNAAVGTALIPLVPHVIFFVVLGITGRIIQKHCQTHPQAEGAARLENG